MRQHAVPVLEQRQAVFRDAAAHGDVFLVYRPAFAPQQRQQRLPIGLRVRFDHRAHPAQRPAQVDRCGPRALEICAKCRKLPEKRLVRCGADRLRHTVRRISGTDANRRRTAYFQLQNGVVQLFRRAQREIDQPVGQLRLIHDDHRLAVVRQADVVHVRHTPELFHELSPPLPHF